MYMQIDSINNTPDPMIAGIAQTSIFCHRVSPSVLGRNALNALSACSTAACAAASVCFCAWTKQNSD